MASWVSNAAVAAPLPARRSRPRPRSRPRAAVRRRPGLLGGVVWIVALAALLGGVVALNVAVLRLNLRLDELAHRETELRATNVALAAQLSHAGSAPQVAAAAQRRLGLAPATPDRTTYVDLAPRRRK